MSIKSSQTRCRRLPVGRNVGYVDGGRTKVAVSLRRDAPSSSRVENQVEIVSDDVLNAAVELPDLVVECCLTKAHHGGA